MKQDDKKPQHPLSKIIWAAIVLALMNPALLTLVLALGIPAGLCWLIYRASRKQKSTPQSRESDSRPKTTYLRECTIPLERHRDKGVHHVRKGRGQDPWDNLEPEIDPWDRPDIDIRKYRRG